MTIIVSCAGDMPMAVKLHKYMMSAQFSGKNTGFETNNVSDYVTLTGDEIAIPGEPTENRKKSVSRVVAQYINSDDNLKDYSIAVFEHVITVSKVLNLERLVPSCEMCGYVASHEDELAAHRLSHGVF